ncbi:hypothetical protein [Microbulbifer sp. PSTR4-B]|uniref:hypothetical protein n=1 Tax=Microbulbifer sp. PSTR4-B TaxID=3243396 RepID=UPI00403A3119
MSGKRQPQNPVIGHWQCPEGSKAEVRQAAKRGRHFYTSCDCCGVNMGAGAARQTKIWREAEFLQGADVFKPSNVSDEGQGEALPAVQSEAAASEPQSEPVGERWRPGEEEEHQEEPEENPAATWIALGVGVAALAVGVLNG